MDDGTQKTLVFRFEGVFPRRFEWNEAVCPLLRYRRNRSWRKRCHILDFARIERWDFARIKRVIHQDRLPERVERALRSLRRGKRVERAKRLLRDIPWCWWPPAWVEAAHTAHGSHWVHPAWVEAARTAHGSRLVHTTDLSGRWGVDGALGAWKNCTTGNYFTRQLEFLIGHLGRVQARTGRSPRRGSSHNWRRWRCSLHWVWRCTIHGQARSCRPWRNLLH